MNGDEFSYSFNVTTTDSSINSGRFDLLLNEAKASKETSIGTQNTLSPITDIYPNPLSSGSMNVRYFGTEDQNIEVEVNNANGIMLKSKNFFSTKNRFNSFQINCDDLPNGVYVVNVKTSNGLKAFKLVKI